ncbi:MAG: hypothetical protein ACI82H_002248, partial [Alphaproteobacteria bacterium]
MFWMLSKLILELLCFLIAVSPVLRKLGEARESQPTRLASCLPNGK